MHSRQQAWTWKLTKCTWNFRSAKSAQKPFKVTSCLNEWNIQRLKDSFVKVIESKIINIFLLGSIIASCSQLVSKKKGGGETLQALAIKTLGRTPA